MPYINPDARIYLEDTEYCDITGPGELNYCISKLCIDYWENSPKKYQSINDILGALEGAKLEFYRRVAVPYEEQKIKENGDIY